MAVVRGASLPLPAVPLRPRPERLSDLFLPSRFAVEADTTVESGSGILAGAVGRVLLTLSFGSGKCLLAPQRAEGGEPEEGP